MEPVTDKRIKIAEEFGLENVPAAAEACRNAGVPFFVACALLEKESMGRNVYGNDVGGVFTDLPSSFRVNRGNFEVFEYYVVKRGKASNGVGPAQITWRGFFPDMRKKGLKPWRPYDNMLYGFGLLALYKAEHGATWEDAGTKYNGARSYGVDFAKKVREWKTRLGVK